MFRLLTHTCISAFTLLATVMFTLSAAQAQATLTIGLTLGSDANGESNLCAANRIWPVSAEEFPFHPSNPDQHSGRAGVNLHAEDFAR